MKKSPHEIVRRTRGRDTVGADAYANKYDTVASAHLKNYLDKLQANNGTPPNTQDIITSYEKALFDNGLDKSAAFDGAWAAAIPGITFLDSSWAGFLGMEVSRMTTSDTTNGLSAIDAAVLIGKDFAQTVASVSLTDPNFLRAIVFRSPVAAALSPTMRDFAKRLGEGTWDYLKDALPTALGWIVPDACGAEISPQSSNAFTAAQRFIPRRDPLTLDLNGNGIETVPINATNPIYFDLTGEGVQTSVGWVAPSDGFLVLDKNGNGTIDDGTELFGDATPAYEPGTTTPSESGKTADGFEALAQEDTNADGVVNAADANFASLRVWQDANQDGISQAGELKTLAELGIESFNVANVAHSQLLANGNQIADTGTYTRTDGSTGTAGVTAGMADVNLAVDTFHRTFTDVIPTTVDTATLPDMQGSGVVRDLREAASIQTLEGATLATALGQFAASTTRNEQRAQLDTLLTDWAATSGFEDMAAQAAAHGYTLTTNLSAWVEAANEAVFNDRRVGYAN